MVEIKIEEKEFAQTKRFSVCDDDGNELGHALLYVLKDESHELPYGVLSDVFVSPNTRGGGIGTKLVNEVIRSADEDFNCYKLICTSKEGRGIVDWYKKLGFKPISTVFRMDFRDAGGKLE